MSKIRLFPLLTAVFVLSACAGTGGGLTVPSEPLRLSGIENPSAQDYYDYGVRTLERSPATSAESFYWASRVDPTWAAPLVGRRLAVFLSDYYLYRQYLSNSRSVLDNPAVQQLDSLYLRALTLNPFLDRGLEAQALRAQWKEMIRRNARKENPSGFLNENAVDAVIADVLQDADYHTRGWVAHCESRWYDAIRFYEQALEDNAGSAELEADLGRVLFMVGRHPEAVEHMEGALANLRNRDDDELVRIYSSKALYLHSIGLIEETRGRTDAARDAYARALQEDLAYHPAHVRLAELALAEGDTATALNEMRLAADIGPNEPTVLLSYGRLLRDTGDEAAAETAFRHLTEVEPFFPTGYRELALVLEARGRPAEAAAAYTEFLERAPRNAPGVQEAEQRLRVLPAPAAAPPAAEGSESGVEGLD